MTDKDHARNMTMCFLFGRYNGCMNIAEAYGHVPESLYKQMMAVHAEAKAFLKEVHDAAFDQISAATKQVKE